MCNLHTYLGTYLPVGMTYQGMYLPVGMYSTYSTYLLHIPKRVLVEYGTVLEFAGTESARIINWVCVRCIGWLLCMSCLGIGPPWDALFMSMYIRLAKATTNMAFMTKTNPA